MPLHLYLKPKELIVIGDALVLNGSRASEITIVNKTPILRQKHLLPDGTTKSVAQSLQYAIQRLLLTEEPTEELAAAYRAALQAAIDHYPRFSQEFALIDQHVRQRHLYQSLQLAIALADVTSPELAMPT
jgi:flagellar biosynthesis regulator FlbT